MAKRKNKPKRGNKSKNKGNKGRGNDQRTLRMIKEFARLKEQNADITIPEVANHFNVSQWTVYRHLGEIAERNGCDRSELLSVPHSKYERNKADRRKEIAINADTLIQHASEITLQINAARAEIAATIKDIESDREE